MDAVSAVLAEVFSSNVAWRARSPISLDAPPAGRAGGRTGLAKLVSIDCFDFLGPHRPRPRPLPVLDFSALGFWPGFEVLGSATGDAGGGVILLGVVLSFLAPLGCRSCFFWVSFSWSFSVLVGVLCSFCGDLVFSSTKMQSIYYLFLPITIANTNQTIIYTHHLLKHCLGKWYGYLLYLFKQSITKHSCINFKMKLYHYLSRGILRQGSNEGAVRQRSKWKLCVKKEKKIELKHKQNKLEFFQESLDMWLASK